MKRTMVSYTPHHFKEAKGHIYVDKPGACTIELTGAAAMSQTELDFFGKKIAEALREINPDELRAYC